MKKEYPPNYLKPHKEMRAKRLKNFYVNSGTFKNDGCFDCGDQIAYEMQCDFAAMQTAIRLMRDSISDSIDDNDTVISQITGKELLILGAIGILKQRINFPENDDDRRFESIKDVPKPVTL